MPQNIEHPKNDVDTIPTYAPGTRERKELLKELEEIRRKPIEIPLVIDGKEVRTNQVYEVKCPHDKDHVLAKAYLAGKEEMEDAIESVLRARQEWAELDSDRRFAVFTRAADVLAGPARTRNIAAIMANHSKNPYEAEIDLAELVDFWNFNVYFAQFLLKQQPFQHVGEINRFDWRPLEGFVVAIPPFNFYSIGGNLPTAPAIVGNVVIWKPSRSVLFSNYEIMKILIGAGLPKGVINFVPFSSQYADMVLKHRDFAGLHFTGSYSTLVKLWQTVSSNLQNYKNFPRIVGEAGGKDFIFVHGSSDAREAAVAIIRGAYGFQGQKCSAASRTYIPESLWTKVKNILLEELPKVKYGPVDDLSNSMGAVIDGDAFEKVTDYIKYAKEHKNEYEFVYGGKYDSSKGWFIEPTVIKTTNPKGKLMTEEIFGPVITVYIYADKNYVDTLKLCDSTSPYGLTGSILAKDKEAIIKAEHILRYSAGNFYINDKPTGAIVGRQPFGGTRASGTNDKAGSWLNVLRWLNPRTIKETETPAKDWTHEFMKK